MKTAVARQTQRHRSHRNPPAKITARGSENTRGEAANLNSEQQNDEQNSDYEWSEQIPQDLPVDANWDDVYNPSTATSSGAEVNLEQVHQVTESFQGHLEWQLNLTPFSDRDREIATAFIDAIDSSGFISEDLFDVVAHIQQEGSQLQTQATNSRRTDSGGADSGR